MAGPRPALLAATVSAFDPLLLRSSLTLQADVPAVALAALAAGLSVESPHHRHRTRALLAAGAGAAAAAALLVKLTALPVLAGLLVVLLLRRDGRGLVFLALGGAVGVAALLAPVAANLEAVWRQSVAMHVSARALPIGGLWATWPVPPAAKGPLALLAIAGVAGALLRRQFTFMAVAGAWMIAAVFFLALQRPLWPHHFVAAAAPAALLAGGAAKFFPERLDRVGVLALASAAACALAVVLSTFAPPTGQVRRLHAILPPGRTVVTDDQFLAASAGYDTPPELVDTSRVRIESGALTLEEVSSATERSGVTAVLLGSGRLQQLPGFMEWASVTFPRLVDIGSGHSLLLK